MESPARRLGDCFPDLVCEIDRLRVARLGISIYGVATLVVVLLYIADDKAHEAV
jgi:hypothetical protein